MNRNGQIGYEEFAQDILNRLSRKYKDEAEITRENIQKINERKDGFTFHFAKNPQIAPTVYVDKMYHDWMCNEMSMDDIVSEIVRQVESSFSDEKFETPDLTINEAKKNLYCVLINHDKNKDLLSQVPHQDCQDLSLIAKWRVSEEASFIVNDSVCTKLKITRDELMELAINNMKKEEYMVFPFEEVIAEFEGRENDMTSDQPCSMVVITNERKLEGAVGMLSLPAMDKARQLCGTDSVFILPSSIHEVIIIPDDGKKNLEELQMMVREVNNTQVMPCDQLSDSVYRYDGKRILLATENEKVETVQQPRHAHHI